MIEFSTYYTPEKVRTYDADEVDVVIGEVVDIIVDVEDILRARARERHIERLEFMAPRIRRLLSSALLLVQGEAEKNG